MRSGAFQKDIDRNSPLAMRRKKWWVFFFLRQQQEAKSQVSRRFFAAAKKIALAGTGCDLPADAIEGGGLRIPHLSGIIISPFSRIGEDCTVFQQVTVGVNERKTASRAPYLGDRVYIGAGAKLIGPITIGDDVTIGANAVVTKDVPSGVTVVGVNKVL